MVARGRQWADYAGCKGEAVKRVVLRASTSRCDVSLDAVLQTCRMADQEGLNLLERL